jgi:hypothetical protein
MKRALTILIVILAFAHSGMSQEKYGRFEKSVIAWKVGVGTSWVILPKVFLTDVNDPAHNWAILPAKNSFTGYIGAQWIKRLGDHWVFAPEIDINYISGHVRVDEIYSPPADTTLSRTVETLQNYVRVEVPFNFGVISNDNFWVTLAPVVYFTLYDNKGFDKAVYSLTDNAVVDSDQPVGLRFRVAAYALLSERMYLDIKFDSDLGRNFSFENGVYDARFSLQSVTVGLGWFGRSRPNPK